MNQRIIKISFFLIGVFISIQACKINSKETAIIVNEIDSIIISKLSEFNQPIKSNLDTTLWTEIQSGQNNILVDMRYAGPDNFVKKSIYPCARCFFRPEVVKKITEIAVLLAKQDLRIKIFDCYRPAHFQHVLWKTFPDWRYITPPKKGSMHGRGLGVDLTLCNMEGKELDMGVPYDYFGKEARHDYVDFPTEILMNRQTLKTAMTEAGFIAGRSEWWHYSLPRKFPLDSIVWNCKKEVTELH